MVKTTVSIPAYLWRDARILALDSRTDFRSIVIAALAAHVKAQAKLMKKEGA
jgi:hypothetical protein